MTKCKPLNINEIKFLSSPHTLFVCDFRATGESLEYDIPAMWKYENLLAHIVDSGTVLCNEDISELQFVNSNQHRIILAKSDDSKISLISKLDNNTNKPSFAQIWTAVPHPDIDTYSRENNIPVQYSYEDFLRFNNKIHQKKLCTAVTPEWIEIENNEHYNKVLQENVFESKIYFLKRSIGSGGYCIWETEDKTNIDNEYAYFVEKKVEGIASSVQICSIGNDNIIFAYSHQLNSNNKEFCGGKILDLKELPAYCLDAINHIIQQLQNGLLNNYQGFWGIDFIDDKTAQKCWFLEANVRLTALTVPSLLKNTYFPNNKGLFVEDSEEKPGTEATLIAIDKHYHTYDVLSKSQ